MKIEIWQVKRTKEHGLFPALGIELGRDYETGLYLRRMEIEQGPLPPYEQFLEDVQRLLRSRGLSSYLTAKAAKTRRERGGAANPHPNCPRGGDRISDREVLAEVSDPDGQPDPIYNRRQRESRDTNELLGVVRGILADGHVADSEIVFLAKWLLTNEELATQWPFSRLVDRLAAVLARPRGLTRMSAPTFTRSCRRLSGTPRRGILRNTPTTFPLTKPEPEIIFDRNEFVLTGKFVHGTRKLCEAEIASRGGSCCDRVTLRTSYLVIGTMSSRDWVNTSWGRKSNWPRSTREPPRLHRQRKAMEGFSSPGRLRGSTMELKRAAWRGGGSVFCSSSCSSSALTFIFRDSRAHWTSGLNAATQMGVALVILSYTFETHLLRKQTEEQVRWLRAEARRSLAPFIFGPDREIPTGRAGF